MRESFAWHPCRQPERHEEAARDVRQSARVASTWSALPSRKTPRTPTTTHDENDGSYMYGSAVK
ncbi:hypothetical protein SPRG_16354 [Saprolegnia parasitica CBS 223.65]|uniref:Uncharacterized protein n=1 Tax=Saprolegnia parasitica (strain CBS 223.65) TaxID=695850 RepID=A0A067BU57_SAPPC|nr:hypothetical protein SPRG_16354 [Saprolegnia parasitica CBS 223.65]KDO18147.1 hypothetical protein SPRG_16354 [Saprolegnia parasitica CBS 223.65]|eukprot:XP_012211148.1 hypothetical protein SPRG_16354 [Saprolegnia parasitica CBS 223.65]